MKALTNEEKNLVGRWATDGYGICKIAMRISERRKSMDLYYMEEIVAEELSDRVLMDDEGTV